MCLSSLVFTGFPLPSGTFDLSNHTQVKSFCVLERGKKEDSIKGSAEMGFMVSKIAPILKKLHFILNFVVKLRNFP